jgi:hypothetical protein
MLMAGWDAAGLLEEEEDYLGHIIPQPDERLVAKHTKDSCCLAGQESSATNVGFGEPLRLKTRGFSEHQRNRGLANGEAAKCRGKGHSMTLHITGHQ